MKDHAANASSGPNDPPEGDFGDDSYCFNAADSTRIQIGGCLGTDDDFDGVPYQLTWPGSLSDLRRDRAFNPSPIIFSFNDFRQVLKTNPCPAHE